MPVSASRMKLYPGGSIRSPEWLALREEILARAGGRCEGTPQFPACRAVNAEPHPETRSKVVLTIAHMDQHPGHNDPSNLRALCQRCHNAWDAPYRRVNASITHHRKRGQPDFFAEAIHG
ncbi:HNH endonuclease [Methylobacterium komagatae]|uniref:HNH endonuclease n=1 Tax=Methylobacterium komagatae TaxID=374425 RepID=A0ABW2BLM3_9HYPH